MGKKLIAIVILIIAQSYDLGFAKAKFVPNAPSAISRDYAERIFQDVVLKKPLYCETMGDKQRPLIVGVLGKAEFDRTYTFVILYNFANKWQTKSTKVYGNEFTYLTLRENFEKVTIDKRTYVYFSLQENEMGTGANGLATISFNLFDPLLDSVISIRYSGRGDSTVEGEFEHFDERRLGKKVLVFLERKAAHSKAIYRPREEDLDLERVGNYEKKWRIDNSFLPEPYKAAGYEEGTLNITYYSTKLISGYTPEHMVQNSNYLVESYFRNDVIGYDKTLNKYFPIWIEFCNVGCDKNIRFATDSVLVISWDEIQLLINMHTHKYEFRKQ